MIDINKIDENFIVKTKVEKDNLCYYDAESTPFKIYGVKKENGKFRRLPEAVATKVNPGVYELHTNTAGGRVRFVTDSPFVAIHAVIEGYPYVDHMPLTGIAGLDIYAREEGIEKYIGCFRPPYGMEGGYESIVDFMDKKERIVTINFPLYSNLIKLYIGLEEGSSLKEAPDYTYEKPFVSYGSSITQGACAARPGNCYQNILSREFDCNYWNLGFSGSARAEDIIVDWMKQLDMSVFLYDYDHNAPNVEHLQATHEKMFCAVRETQPDLPIIIMSRPKYYLNDEEKKRLEIIRMTYENAVAAGDNNVYFIDGPTLMAEIKDNGLVDIHHPTDSGFVSMAKAIAPILGKLLQNSNEKKGEHV